MTIEQSEIHQRFWPSAITTAQADDIKVLRTQYEALAAMILELTATRREQNLALTKLEESSFWVVKAIVRETATSSGRTADAT